MFTQSWNSTKPKSYHYKRRSPETSSLYRIAYQERQNLEYQWEQQFQQKFGSYELSAIDNQSLQELFTHKVLKSLLHKELITQDNIDYLMSQKHTGFSAWMGERVDLTDNSFRLFLARYIDRGPVANSKIQIDDDIVTYITEKDTKTHESLALKFGASPIRVEIAQMKISCNSESYILPQRSAEVRRVKIN